jgi:hypothetical protein
VVVKLLICETTSLQHGFFRTLRYPVNSVYDEGSQSKFGKPVTEEGEKYEEKLSHTAYALHDG